MMCLKGKIRVSREGRFSSYKGIDILLEIYKVGGNWI